MNFEECIKKGLIKKEPEAESWVKKEIKIAERFLKSARRTMEIEEYNVVELAAYLAAFHAARALLYAKGFKERSHICLGIAIKALYDDEMLRDYMNTFDRIREMRHGIQYLGREPSKEECELVLSFASELIKLAKRILGLTSSSSKE